MRRLLVVLTLVPVFMFALPASAGHQPCEVTSGYYDHGGSVWNGDPVDDCVEDYGGYNNSWKAFGGDDYMRGNLGADYLYGGDNIDTIYGGAGSDHVFGQYGDDWLFESTFSGGDVAFDSLIGAQGNDLLFCGRGSDVCSGGPNGVYGDTLYHCQDGNADTISGIERTVALSYARGEC